MSTLSRRRSFLVRSAAAAALLVACAVASAPADVVILKDGFVIQGNVRKEMESVRDAATGQSVLVFKGAGFDTVDDGPRVVVFSSHHKQLGEISKDVKVRPDYKAYSNPLPNRRANNQLPQMLGAKEMPDFNDKWRRTLNIKTPDGFVLVDQQLTYLDPYCCFVVSSNFAWSQSFRTSEMDPRKVRKLLSTHPELVESDGKPDPVKRIAIARFMKDAGWLYLAKEEVDRLKKEVPAPLPKEAQEQFDKLLKDMDGATAELVVSEAEIALKAGRYKYTDDLLAAFPDKTAEPKERDRATKLMAQLKTAREQYDTGRRLLRGLIDEVTGAGSALPFLAVGGSPLVAVLPRKVATTD
ncbi:MAG: hypothetical protein JWO38_5036, partial [Gemmataceae bacterium]|nr:hypothetical protein [Gemmataceae bacterium]